MLQPCIVYRVNPQSYGKLTYFITLFPYVVLTIFLVMGSFEEGFATGITDFYLKVQKLPFEAKKQLQEPEIAYKAT